MAAEPPQLACLGTAGSAEAEQEGPAFAVLALANGKAGLTGQFAAELPFS